MTLAIAILANRNLDRVAQLAESLDATPVRVCIHVDAHVDDTAYFALKRRLAARDNIVFAERIACAWGHFSLVEAELALCRKILSIWDSVEHIQLISGDSLPIKPVSDLLAFLAKHKGVDFIESVSVVRDDWIVGGLGIERFTLRFPFLWKKQRRLFDLWVSVQRRLRLQRAIPDNIKPHIGSQWWCLTRKTVLSILNDPDKESIDAYFRTTWIPDESYFQTLARKHSAALQSRSLVFSHFDHQGKPVIYYDDHADMLAGVDAFFARKIWPGAEGLYQRFTGGFPYLPTGPVNSLASHIEQATERRRIGRSGLHMSGRAPNRWYEPQPATAAPYQVFGGFSACYPGFVEWLGQKQPAPVHGRLFAPDRVYFANRAEVGPGGLSSRPHIRDNAPECFLRNLAWQSRGGTFAFRYEPMDSPSIEKFLARDPNAGIHIIQYGWILELAERGITNPDVLRVAAVHLLAREQGFLNLIQGAEAKCTPRIWTLGEALSNPAPVLSGVLSGLGVDRPKTPMALPAVADMDKAHAFARMLKNIGVDIDLHKLDTVPAREVNPRAVSGRQ